MRKKIEITLEDSGNSLDFIITEMPATKAESWLIRVILLLAKAGGDDIPIGSDMAAATEYIASKGIGILSGIDYEKAKPLLDELLECCTFKNTSGAEIALNANKVDAIVGEVKTLVKLRVEAFKVNFSFFNLGDHLRKEPVAQKRTTKITRT